MSRTFFSFFLYLSSGFSTKEYQFAGMVLDIKDWMSGGGTELLFNLYVYRYTDTYKYMYIYIYILYVYIVYTHYIHILLMYRKERLVDFCRNLPMRRIGAYSQCTSQNRSVSLVANLAAVKSATYFWTQGWVSFKKKTCETM